MSKRRIKAIGIVRYCGKCGIQGQPQRSWRCWFRHKWYHPNDKDEGKVQTRVRVCHRCQVRQMVIGKIDRGPHRNGKKVWGPEVVNRERMSPEQEEDLDKIMKNYDLLTVAEGAFFRCLNDQRDRPMVFKHSKELIWTALQINSRRHRKIMESNNATTV